MVTRRLKLNAVKTKKTKLYEKTYNGISYWYDCPHCHTECHGNAGKDTLMVKCMHCGKAVDFREPKPKEIK